MPKKTLITALVVLNLFAWTTIVQAEKKYSGFDDNIKYDVHFYSGDSSTSVLENVSIVGFQQIGGKEFLVVQSKGFRLNEESGYILFDSVVAILPERHFRVKRTDTLLKKYHSK